MLARRSPSSGISGVVVGQGLGECILKALEQESGVETPVRMALSGLDGQRRQTVIHGRKEAGSERQ